MILSRAEGNPFFLEELALSIQDRGGLAGDLAVPDTVQGVLLSRIGHLAETEQALLQSAAVIGKDVPLPVLAAVTELAEDPLGQALRHLSAAEFLYEVSSVPGGQVSLPARAHPRGRLREPPTGAPPAAPRPHRPRHRGRATRTACSKTSVGSPITPREGSSGRRRSSTRARPAPRPPRARLISRRSRTSSRRWRLSPICPRIARGASRPSICGSSCATRCTRSETPSGSSRCCGRPKRSPGPSTIRDGSPVSSRS